MPLSVSVNPRNTGFVKLGENHRYKVVPESIKFGADINEYGSLDCSMMLQINPLMPHYDLEQFTPIVINDGTIDLWSGRIIGTPIEYGNSGILTVEGQGWGQHIKDDCTANQWVVGDCLNNAKDAREWPYANLGNCNSDGVVTVGDGAVTMLWKSGTTPRANGFAGFFLDFGPDPAAWPIMLAFDFQTSANYANGSWYVYNSSTDPTGVSGRFDMPGFFNVVLSAYPNRTFGAGSWSQARRYVGVFIFNAAATALGADVWLRMTKMIAFTKGSYCSYDAVANPAWSGTTPEPQSILTASTAIKESLAICSPLISPDTSKIAATALALPNFPGSMGNKYNNSLIDAANTPHGYKFYLTPQPVPVPVFEPQSSDYKLVLGAQDEYGFKDPSRNDGRVVYNRIISEFQDANSIQNYSSYSTPWTQIPQNIPNPSFDVNTTGWQMSSGTIARDTTTFDSTPASGLMTGDASGTAVCDQLITPIQLQPLTKYRCIMKLKKNSASDCRGSIYIRDEYGSPLNMTIKSNYDDVFSAMDFVTWYLVSVDFITSASGKILGPGFAVRGTAFNPVLWVDTVSFYSRSATVVDRRGFQRTALRPMEGKSTSAIADQIALLEYNNSQFPPLKGSVEVTGFIRTKEGDRIKVNRVPSMVGKCILFEQFKDPNTGAFGRQATIKAASYDEITDTVSITCDNDFNFIQNLRARLLL